MRDLRLGFYDPLNLDARVQWLVGRWPNTPEWKNYLSGIVRAYNKAIELAPTCLHVWASLKCGQPEAEAAGPAPARQTPPDRACGGQDRGEAKRPPRGDATRNATSVEKPGREY